jgi:hypothetical protein
MTIYSLIDIFHYGRIAISTTHVQKSRMRLSYIMLNPIFLPLKWGYSTFRVGSLTGWRVSFFANLMMFTPIFLIRIMAAIQKYILIAILSNWKAWRLFLNLHRGNRFVLARPGYSMIVSSRVFYRIKSSNSVSMELTYHDRGMLIVK